MKQFLARTAASKPAGQGAGAGLNYQLRRGGDHGQRPEKRPAPTPRPFRGYNAPSSNQQSGVVFWQWFDSLPAADRKALNDYAGPQEGFRALVERIARRQLEQLERNT